MHPQSREGQTDSATVQGHLVHPSVWAPGETNKVNDISCRVLMMQYFTTATMAYDRGISGHNQALLSISNPQTSLACPSGDWAGSSQIGAVSIGETLGFTRYLQGPLSYLSTLTEQQWSFFFCRCRARLKLRRSSIHLVLIGDSPVREKR